MTSTSASCNILNTDFANQLLALSTGVLHEQYLSKLRMFVCITREVSVLVFVSLLFSLSAKMRCHCFPPIRIKVRRQMCCFVPVFRGHCLSSHPHGPWWSRDAEVLSLKCLKDNTFSGKLELYLLSQEYLAYLVNNGKKTLRAETKFSGVLKCFLHTALLIIIQWYNT